MWKSKKKEEIKEIKRISKEITITTEDGEEIKTTTTWDDNVSFEQICAQMIQQGVYIPDLAMFVKVKKITWQTNPEVIN